MANILIIDDDPLIGDTISHLVKRMGHQPAYASTLQAGLASVCSHPFDMVFLDVRLPDGNGLEELPRVQAAPSLPEVIIMTGFGDPDGAELAIRHGAWDYLQKPANLDALTLTLSRALQYREEKRAQKDLTALKREGIIGNSSKIRACLDLVSQVANSEANVLITGETGTGKELIALAIHKNSRRGGKNFVVWIARPSRIIWWKAFSSAMKREPLRALTGPGTGWSYRRTGEPFSWMKWESFL